MKWVDFFRNQARIILVTVQDEATAYIVFETMNDRGLELSAIDLIKNRLFALSGDRIEQTKSNWSKMLGKLETIRSPTIVKDYVRHHWIAKHGRTRAPVLFKAIKEEITNQKRAIEFAAQLESDATQYVALLNPSDPLWRQYDPSVAEAVRVLRVFGVSQIRPMLVSVMRRITKRKEIKNIFQLTISWCVRLMAADQLSRGGVLETEYETAALEIHRGNIQTAESVSRQLRNVIPDDQRFVEDFANFTIVDERQAMYLLTELERIASGQKLIVPDDEMTLEHILPKNPDDLKDWPDFTADEYEDYVDRLGGC